MIDADTVQFFVAVNCLFGADGHAGSILTVLAAHGDVHAGIIPFDHMNTRYRRITHPIVLNRANQFTIPATRAFFRINNHYFLTHRIFPITIRIKSTTKALGDENTKNKYIIFALY
jgi:hypothetical protein